jgi:hypothetical protein
MSVGRRGRPIPFYGRLSCSTKNDPTFSENRLGRCRESDLRRHQTGCRVWIGGLRQVGLELIESHAPGREPAAYGAEMSKELDGWLKLIGCGEGLEDARHDC